MREADLQRAVLDWLAAKGILALRINNTGIWDPKRKVFRKSPNTTKGVPDIIAIVNGRFVGIEVKGPSAKITNEQRELHQRIADAGGIAMFVRSIEELEQDFEELGL